MHSQFVADAYGSVPISRDYLEIDAVLAIQLLLRYIVKCIICVVWCGVVVVVVVVVVVIWYDMTRYDMTPLIWHDMTWHGMTWHDTMDGLNIRSQSKRINWMLLTFFTNYIYTHAGPSAGTMLTTKLLKFPKECPWLSVSMNEIVWPDDVI